jgi:hypothetical protein
MDFSWRPTQTKKIYGLDIYISILPLIERHVTVYSKVFCISPQLKDPFLGAYVITIYTIYPAHETGIKSLVLRFGVLLPAALKEHGVKDKNNDLTPKPLPYPNECMS